MKRLEGKVCLVTGSTRHTGLGIAEELLREGALVYINGRGDDAVANALESLQQDFSETVFAAPCDLSDSSAIERMMDAILADQGRIDVLVNNACHLGLGHDILHTSYAFFDEVLTVNLKAPFYCSRLAGEAMRRQGAGAIINIGSITSRRVLTDRAAYIASKGGLDSLTRATAAELAPYGIRVNMIVPGYVHTSRWDQISEQVRQRRKLNMPLGREATAREVGRSVVFLASEQSGNMTGGEIVLDGGSSLVLFPKDVEA